MACVPVIFSGVFYPQNKKDAPMPGTFVGNAAIAGLEVGGGPMPGGPGKPGDPPLVIWGGGNEPFPTPPIWWDGFPGNPPPDIKPPDGFPAEPGPVKPFPKDGGWGYSDRTGWVFNPGEGQAGPKKR